MCIIKERSPCLVHYSNQQNKKRKTIETNKKTKKTKNKTKTKNKQTSKQSEHFRLKHDLTAV